MQPGLEWLTHSVPLWAFIVALLTNPYEWSHKVSARLAPLLDAALPSDQGDAANVADTPGEDPGGEE